MIVKINNSPVRKVPTVSAAAPLTSVHELMQIGIRQERQAKLIRNLFDLGLFAAVCGIYYYVGTHGIHLTNDLRDTFSRL